MGSGLGTGDESPGSDDSMKFLLQQAAISVSFLIVMSGLFILLSLLVHGEVKWN